MENKSAKRREGRDGKEKDKSGKTEDRKDFGKQQNERKIMERKLTTGETTDCHRI